MPVDVSSTTNRKSPVAPHHGISARRRVLAAVAAGLGMGGVVAVTADSRAAPLLGWIAAATTFCGWTWWEVWPQNPQATAAHAGREDPSRAVSDAACVLAAVASLIAVGVVLVDAGNAKGSGKLLDIALGIAAVVASWLLVHTIFTLRYARTYYTSGRGVIDFNQEDPPAYSDFAYIALTIGMTFQVSDTDLKSNGVRRLALRHMLLSYLMGAVFIAVTINLVAALAK